MLLIDKKDHQKSVFLWIKTCVCETLTAPVALSAAGHYLYSSLSLSLSLLLSPSTPAKAVYGPQQPKNR